MLTEDTAGVRAKPAPWTRAWPWVALTAASFAAHAKEILGARPYFRDSHQVYVPAKMYLAERLRAGELPQWWPWDGAGSPLIPQPVFSVFHPTTLLYLLLPFWDAFTAQNLCGTWLALLGAYVLARALGLSRSAAAVTGVLYGLNGYVACLSEHQFMKLAAGTMPWYLAALVVADRRRGAWVAAPAATMGLLLITGDPQIAILASGAGVVLLLARTSRRGRALLLSTVSPLAGALLAAAQLWPSLAVIADTERGHVMAAERWGLTPAHLFGFLWPVDFGPSDWARSTFFGWAGMGLVAASLVGLTMKRRRRVIGALVLLALSSIWLSFGHAGGLNDLARRIVPIWSQLRYPMKSIVLAYLALALLAGFGFAHVSTERLRPRLLLASLIVSPVLIAIFAGTGASLQTATLLVSFVLAGSAQRTLAALAVVAQVTASAIPLFLTVAPEFYDEPSPITVDLRKDGVGLTGPAFERTFVPIDPHNWATVARAGAGGLQSSLGAIHRLPCLSPSMPGASWRLQRLFDADRIYQTNERLLGVFGVGDVVMPEPVAERLQPQIFARDPSSGYSIIHLRHVLDRAYVTSRARAVPSGAAALDALFSEDFKPGREVIIESATPDLHWPQRPETPAIPARVEHRARSNTVRVHAELPWPGFVVLNEANFAGWTATVDGAPAPVLTANAIVRAVEAPAGVHEVAFTFHTPGLRGGIAVSLFSWLLLAGFAVRSRRRG